MEREKEKSAGFGVEGLERRVLFSDVFRFCGVRGYGSGVQS